MSQPEGEEDLAAALGKLAVDSGVDTGPGFEEGDPQDVLEHKFRSAALDGTVETLQLMIEKKLVSVNCMNPTTNQTALHCACTQSQLEAVKFLLEQEGIDIDPKDSYGNSPLDLLPKNAKSKQITQLLEAKLKEAMGEEGVDATKLIGEMTPIEKIQGGRYKYHVFICHDYKDHKKAQVLKEKLSALSVTVGMTESMMANPAETKSSVEASKLVLILTSKTFFSKLKDPSRFGRSGCIIEMDSFVLERDVSDIVIAAADSASTDPACWMDCPDYDAVAEEGIVFDLSNDKLLDENLPSLYKEIKLRASS